MNIQSIKTAKIHRNETTIQKIIDEYFQNIPDKSIVVVTSKIISMCEDRTVRTGTPDKTSLAESEAELYLPPTKSKYNITLTVKHNMLIPSAGIDESNGDGDYILWPENPQKSANGIREHLALSYKEKQIGVVISDSKTTPLRWGTTGISLAHSGFCALNDFIGKPDIFGRPLTMTKVQVADALACAAVLVMGESNEQTPLALITDIPFVQFQNRNPTVKELEDLHIALEDDVYAPLLTSVQWEKKSSQ